MKYYHVDVFTSQKFGGNQLAVFTDARGLTTDEMQTIAREMNFAETTFVLPPQNADNHFKVRIFTPTIEMPMAGHPTIGTAYVLRHTSMYTESLLRFEEGVGVVPVELEERADGIFATMTQPLPTFGPVYTTHNNLAILLGLNAEDISRERPAQVVTCGVPYLIIPVTDVDAVRRISVRADLWKELLGSAWPDGIYVFAQRPTGPVRCRMFSVELGIWEDAATGSAAGPLGSYLVHHGLANSDETMIFEQGYEMNRPSQLHVTIGMDGQSINRVRVGGYSVYIGTGELEL